MRTHAESVIRLRTAWSRQEFTDGEAHLYGERLSRFPAELVSEAVDNLIDTAIFRPSIGQIIERIAEQALQLPTPEEAWEIAESGSLKHAPEAVRRAAEYVGGRWAILNTDNPLTLRSQFRKAYVSCRQTALNDYATGDGAARRELVVPFEELGPTMAELDVTERVRPRPVMERLMARWGGRDLSPPTEEEKQDAIEVLRDGTWADDPSVDPLYAEAERVFEDGAA